jgi:hypothetical protein
MKKRRKILDKLCYLDGEQNWIKGYHYQQRHFEGFEFCDILTREVEQARNFSHLNDDDQT